MNDKVHAAYQLLNNANKSFRRSFEENAQGLEYLRQAFELLQVQNMLESVPTPIAPLPTQTQQPAAGMGCKIKVAVWARGERLSASLTVSENGQEAHYKFSLFQSKPNDRGLLLNGNIFPKNASYDRENQAGGVFVYAAVNNGRRLSATLDETPVNNKLSFEGLITPVQNRKSDDSPHFEMECQTAERFFRAITTVPPNTMNVAETPMQQLTGDNVLSGASPGLMSMPGLPADPVVVSGHPLGVPQPSTDNASLVNSSVEDLRKLLG